MKMIHLSENKYIILFRNFLGEVAIGLALAWWFLFLAEFWREGLVSFHLDLNLLLGITLACWLLGLSPKVISARPYASSILSAILITVIVFKLADGTVWQIISPFLGLAVGLLWFLIADSKGTISTNND